MIRNRGAGRVNPPRGTPQKLEKDFSNDRKGSKMRRGIFSVPITLAVLLIGTSALAQMSGPPGGAAPPGYFFAPAAHLAGFEPAAPPAGGNALNLGTASAGPGLLCQPQVPTWSFFADIIYLSPRNQEVAIAVPADGPIDFGRVPVQNGPTVLADFGYDPGFRLGSTFQLSECSKLRSTFTWLEATTNAWGSTNPPRVMWPMITHPELSLADRQFLDAGARYLLDIELFDVDWVRVLNFGPFHQLDLVVGARYVGLSQELRSFFVATGRDEVATDVNYNGGGIRVGLEGEWFDTTRCWLIYARSAASFTVGEFRCGYRQDNNLGQRLVETSWKAGRVVSMLDLEIGLGWQNQSETVRLTAGYLFSGWHNPITVPEYIQAVQTNSYVGMGDFMTFDGLVGRIEFRF